MKIQTFITHGVVAMILLPALAGCHKQLDLQPDSQTSAGNYYKTADDINQAVAACYDALQGPGEYGQDFIFFMEVAADNARTTSITNSGGIYGDFDLCRVTPANTLTDETWNACYAGIQRCNVVLNRIGQVPMADSLKSVRSGEARFIRALTYFNMVRIWGDVPLVTREVLNPFDEFSRGRDSSSKVYAQIETDLTEAVNILPPTQTGANLGRVAKGAAQALLAKVYLTQQKYDQARVLLQQVRTSKVYDLLPNYTDIFKTNNKNNRESLFEIQYKKGGLGEGSAFANIFAVDASLIGSIGEVRGDCVPTKVFMDGFQANDGRKAAFIGTVGSKNYCKKYIDIPSQNKDADNNFTVLRYADVLLMYAEAVNELVYPDTSAFNAVNAIRGRAGLVALTTTNTTSQDAFRIAIQKERQYELCFENHRWFDLARTGALKKTLNGLVTENGTLDFPDHRIVFPIPQGQVNVKKGLIIQNKDYF
jgi:hypothetical protein